MKALTLKFNRDFRRIYSKGKTQISPELVTYVMKNKYNNLRIGITTSKKIGTAVQRNRCRRIIRAAFQNLQDQTSPGYDIIFVARTKTGFLKSYDVERCMKKHLTRSGVIKKHTESYEKNTAKADPILPEIHLGEHASQV